MYNRQGPKTRSWFFGNEYNGETRMRLVKETREQVANVRKESAEVTPTTRWSRLTSNGATN